MKLIKAVVEPWIAAQAISALSALDGSHCVGVSLVAWVGAGCSLPDPKVNTGVEVVVTDEEAAAVLQVFEEKALAGRSGGHIFVLDIEKSICIRSGRHDES